MTRGSTRAIVEQLERLGKECGLVPSREVSPGVPHGYAPRTDLVLCGKRLPDKAAAAVDRLAKLAGIASPLVDRRMPWIGFEVEGTDPTSKTMESDFANLLVCGYPIGALVVDSAPGGARANVGDIHRRAARLRRTTSLWCGARALAVVDRSQLPLRARLGSRDAASPKPPSLRNQGGSRKDAKVVRERLLAIGHDLGFHADCDVVPILPEISFDARRSALREDGAPPSGSTAVLLGIAAHELGDDEPTAYENGEKAFTRQRLDVAWSVPVPRGVREFHDLLAAADRDYGLLWPEPPLGSSMPLVAFEIDTDARKHAGGSLLHLARAARIGVLVVPDEKVEAAQRMLDTYRRVMPVGAAAVLGFSEAVE